MKKIHLIAFSALIATTIVILASCQGNTVTKTVTVTSPPTTVTITIETSRISESCAIAIASSIIPPDYRSLAQPQAYFDEEQGQNGIWLVNLEKLNITREELEQFGWQEGENVSFGNTIPGTNKYYGVLVYIDGKTGEIISQKAIDIWLGTGAPEVFS